MTVTVIIAAAGKGTRLGFEQPKAFVPLCGKTILEHCVESVKKSQVDHIIITVSEDMFDYAAQLLATDIDSGRIRLVFGGVERADSVWEALKTVDEQDSYVLVHDAARCLTPPELFNRVIEELYAGKKAVIPVVPVCDTIKEVKDNRVVHSPVRSNLRAAQTPQGFYTRELVEANQAYFAKKSEGCECTDDASLMEYTGVPVYTVPGDERALKITTEQDYILACHMLKAREDNGF